MKFPCILFLLSMPLSGIAEEPIKLSGHCELRFATLQEGKAIVATEDEFTKRMSKFDLQSRLQTTKTVLVRDYLDLVSESVQEWTEKQKEKLLPIIKLFANDIRSFDLPLPKRILLVRSTGSGEASAPHTRGNAIILPDAALNGPPLKIRRLLAHELFHILSRGAPRFRDTLYATIGYERCDEITLAEDVESLRLTNPDAPIVEHFIKVQVKEKEVAVTQILLSKRGPYAGQRIPFFGLMAVKFLELRKSELGWVAATDLEGNPIFHPPARLENFISQVGNNTQYLIHPEEILADNFSYLVTNKQVASPHVLDAIRQAIKELSRKPVHAPAN